MINRRQFLKKGLAGSAAALTAGLPLRLSAASSASTSSNKFKSPNILVVLVDQMRLPSWMPASVISSCLPNLSALWSKSVTFQNHFTASAACSPSRSCLVTGLYTYQNGMFPTGGQPPLLSAFPTYGSVLQNWGYRTNWFGKWHLSLYENVPNPLAAYGFAGGTYPDPTGGTNEMGINVDPSITAQFTNWLKTQSSQNTSTPWCTTVSFVNPHDVAGFWADTDCNTTENGPTYSTTGITQQANFLTPSYFQQYFGGNSCGNFENPNAFSTPKPGLQTESVNWFSSQFGGISYDPSTINGANQTTSCRSLDGFHIAPLPTQPFSYWYKLLQLYVYLHSLVDAQIGAVLNALQASPFAQNTIVIFTSDHGEYGGAHGLRDKGMAAYEEAIKVPFSVYDPTQQFAQAPGICTGLTSSIDLMPLLLTLASGSNSWTQSSTLSYLGPQYRYDLTTLLKNPKAPGRNYILYTTDEFLAGMTQDIPYHVATYRTAAAKFSTYRFWNNQYGDISSMSQSSGEQTELYDYRTGDYSEVNNINTESDLYQSYYQTLLGAGGLMQTQLTAPLPPVLMAAQKIAYNNYFNHITTTEVETKAETGIQSILPSK